MKKSNLKSATMAMAILLFAFITSCGSNQQEENAGEEMEMTEGVGMEGMGTMEQEEAVATTDLEGQPAFLVDYINVKNALVEDNFEQVKQEAAELQNSIQGSELNEDMLVELKDDINQLVEAQDIAGQRQAFSQLSQELYEVVQNTELTDKTLYWQYCPMAMNNAGANWLSFEEQVQNPYMGQRMPRCGSVAETIN